MKETMETKEVFLHPKYDVTDFRSEDMKIIEELLKGTDDFRIEIESTKELTNAQIYGKKNGIELRVEWYMDEVGEGVLIEDALVATDLEVKDDAEWDELCNFVWDSDIHDVCGESTTISRDSSYQDVIGTLDLLSKGAHEGLDEEWERLKTIVSGFISERRAS